MATHFVAAIDDSGIPKPVCDWDGNEIRADFPYVGLAAFVLAEHKLEELEGRWTYLRKRIHRQLGLSRTAPLPPIHLRWMWGRNPPLAKGQNPYVDANFKDIRSWLTDARRILTSLLQDTETAAIFGELRERSAFVEDQKLYYTDPKFTAELTYLRSHKLRGRTGRLYSLYHSITSNPVIRLLTVMLWRLEQDLRLTDATVEVHVDKFSSSSGIDAEVVLATSRKLARLSQVTSLQQVEDYSASALCQAADVIAYSVNRFALVGNSKIQQDNRFAEALWPLINSGKTFTGHPITEPAEISNDAVQSTLCVVYALAHQQLSKRDPEFVATNLVSIEEFHERVFRAADTSATGVSILRDEVMELLVK